MPLLPLPSWHGHRQLYLPLPFADSFVEQVCWMYQIHPQVFDL
jgi:hypothetical protein